MSKKKMSIKAQFAKFQSKISTSKLCFHPKQNECSGQIIRAHSVSKSAGLRHIADNGHVLMFKKKNFNVGMKPGSTIDVEEVGINKATVFYGFCSYHDDTTFKSIDDPNYELNIKNAVLFGFRSLAKEIYAKYDVLKNCIEGIEEFTDERFIEISEINANSQRIGIIESAKTIKSYQYAVRNDIYDEFESCWIRFEGQPIISFSGGFAPEFDFQGNQLEDYNFPSEQRNFIHVNGIARETSTDLVFTWKKSARFSKQFVDSFIEVPDHRKSDAMIYMAFEHLENLAFSKSWWESMRPLQRTMLKRRFMSGIDLTIERTSSSLKIDSKSYSDLEIDQINFYA